MAKPVGEKEQKATKRETWPGDAEYLASVLMPYVTKPNFLVYGTDPEKDKLDKSVITQQAPMLRQLKELQPNLAFKGSTLRRALAHVLQSRDTIAWFGSDAKMMESWIETQALRIKCLLRHLSQAIFKARGAHSSWISSVMQPPQKMLPQPDPPQPDPSLAETQLVLSSPEKDPAAAAAAAASSSSASSAPVVGSSSLGTAGLSWQ